MVNKIMRIYAFRTYPGESQIYLSEYVLDVVDLI